MKAEELMIGDWVYNKHHKKNIKITPFDFFTHGHLPSGRQYFIGEPELVSGRDLEPIPFTPEILEKNGFVINNHVYPYPYYEYVDKKYKLNIGFGFPQGNQTIYKEPWVCIDSKYIYIEHLPCIYVHQLQHILKLCGIEKEIIL